MDRSLFVSRMSCSYWRQFFIFLVLPFLLSACVGGLPGISPASGQTTATNSRSTAASGAAGTTVFVVVPEESEARFILSEELLGAPRTVIGASRQLNGEFYVDPANPASTSIGAIQIDARAFVTDNERRDIAIRRFILQSDRDEYQFITFTPTEISGLPESSNVGDEFSFQVTGDLQIRDVTHPVTFDVTITVPSATELRGAARAVVLRPDFDLSIPQVPNVANVSEDVTLEFDFIARSR
jgi:polyisoprenoid-binding protein YceI